MRSVGHGVQWTSHVSPRTTLTAAVMAIALLLPAFAADPAPAAAATDYILMSRAALMARPVTGTPWRNLKAVADGSLGTPNLCDQNSRHHLRTLAAALVYARTGVASYGAKARGGVIAAIKTLRVGCDNATLALGRQLTAYVLAANFADMTGSSDVTFRAFLSTIVRRIIGGHGVWDSLYHTHIRSATNWGAYAGAATDRHEPLPGQTRRRRGCLQGDPRLPRRACRLQVLGPAQLGGPVVVVCADQLHAGQRDVPKGRAPRRWRGRGRHQSRR